MRFFCFFPAYLNSKLEIFLADRFICLPIICADGARRTDELADDLNVYHISRQLFAKPHHIAKKL